MPVRPCSDKAAEQYRRKDNFICSKIRHSQLSTNYSGLPAMYLIELARPSISKTFDSENPLPVTKT
jgi:hypothetical protein